MKKRQSRYRNDEVIAIIKRCAPQGITHCLSVIADHFGVEGYRRVSYVMVKRVARENGVTFFENHNIGVGLRAAKEKRASELMNKDNSFIYGAWK
jgi:hypothetical protein